MSGSDVARVILMYIDATKWHLTAKWTSWRCQKWLCSISKSFPFNPTSKDWSEDEEWQKKDEKWHVWDFGGFCGGSSNSCLPSSWWVRRQHWTQFRLVQHPNNNFKFSFLLDFSLLICKCDRCFDCLWTVVISFWNRDPNSPFPCALADHTS